MRKIIRFILNDEIVETQAHPALTLLDFIRRQKHLTGTKEGCREGDCGACSVILGESNGSYIRYKAVNSCLFPIGDADGKHVVTIEGINIDGAELFLTPFQQALLNEGGTQCGFCTPGFVVSFAAYLLSADKFIYADAIDSMTGNLCRCTGHTGIRRSAEIVIDYINRNWDKTTFHRAESLVNLNLLPSYFTAVPEKLSKLIIENEEICAEEKKSCLQRENDIIKPGIALAESGDMLVAESPKNFFQPKEELFWISGGTDIFVQKGDELIYRDVNLLSSVLAEPVIEIDGSACKISANTTVADLENSSLFNQILPQFREIARLFGSQQIRNRATIGGNINNASPIGDMTIFFLAMNAKIILGTGNKWREILLKEYFKGYKTLDRNPGEIMKSLFFRLPHKRAKISFEKVCRRTYLDIASVNSAMYLLTDNDIISTIHLSSGGTGPVPMYLKSTCEYLTGKAVSYNTIKEAARIADGEISPISDIRGSAEYKRILLRQLLFAHFLKFFPEKINAEELV